MKCCIAREFVVVPGEHRHNFVEKRMWVLVTMPDSIDAFHCLAVASAVEAASGVEAAPATTQQNISATGDSRFSLFHFFPLTSGPASAHGSVGGPSC